MMIVFIDIVGRQKFVCWDIVWDSRRRSARILASVGFIVSRTMYDSLEVQVGANVSVSAHAYAYNFKP